MSMTEEEMESAVKEALDYIAEVEEDGPLGGASVQTFAEAGLLTINSGVVLRVLDGTVFQLTIVRSG